jgi:hypothetical protein
MSEGGEFGEGAGTGVELRDMGAVDLYSGLSSSS